MRVSRAIAGFLIVAVLFGAASYPIQLAAQYLLRETYRLCEGVGIMSPGGSLGGQVMGFNYQRHPAWVHPVARSATTVIAMTPGLVCALLLYHRVAFGSLGWRDTLCGSCGRARALGGECRCGHSIETEPSGCGTGWLAAQFGPARAVLFRRCAAACVVAGVVATYAVVRDDWQGLQQFFLELGMRLGGQVVQVGVVVYGPDGPFFGEGSRPALLNLMWRVGPRLVIYLGALAAALLAYDPAVRWLWRWRFTRPVLGYRGPTMCGRCGYRLAGNRAGRCPECGSS